MKTVFTFTFRPEKIPLVPVPRLTSGSSRRLNAASGARKAGTPSGASANRLTAASIAADSDGRASPVTGRKKDRVSQSGRLAAGAGSFFEAVSSGWFGNQGK